MLSQSRARPPQGAVSPGRPGAAPGRKREQKESKKKKKGDYAVLGASVALYWKTMKQWYTGTITHVDPEDEALAVTFDDGDELTYPPNFQGWRWKIVKKAPEKHGTQL